MKNIPASFGFLGLLGVVIQLAFWLVLTYGVLWILREFGVLQALGIGT